MATLQEITPPSGDPTQPPDLQAVDGQRQPGSEIFNYQDTDPEHPQADLAQDVRGDFGDTTADSDGSPVGPDFVPESPEHAQKVIDKFNKDQPLTQREGDEHAEHQSSGGIFDQRSQEPDDRLAGAINRDIARDDSREFVPKDNQEADQVIAKFADDKNFQRQDEADQLAQKMQPPEVEPKVSRVRHLARRAGAAVLVKGLASDRHEKS